LGPELILAGFAQAPWKNMKERKVTEAGAGALRSAYRLANEIIAELAEGIEPAVKVFQYGSNCSVSEINSESRLRGDAKVIGIAETVEDFELAFDVWSTKRDCA